MAGQFRCRRCGAIHEKDDEGKIRVYIPRKTDVEKKKREKKEKEEKSEKKKGFWE